MSGRGFRHIGEVKAIESDGALLISMQSSTACEGCHAKGACTVSRGLGGDSGERELLVDGAGSSVSVGDRVEVGITYGIGFMAVVVAYVVPLVLFVVAIAVMVGLGVDEGLAAGSAFLVGGLYYGVVYALRDRFERVVRFEVHKIDN